MNPASGAPDRASPTGARRKDASSHVDLKPRQRQGLAILLLVVFLAVVYAAAIHPVIAKFGFYQEVIEDSAFRLERLRTVAAERPAIEARLAALRNRQDSARQYIDRDNPALAAADLQQKVDAIVKTAGGQIASAQVVQRPPEGSHVAIALRVRITGSSATLQQVLHTLESSRQPMLLVENLNVRTATPRRRPDQPEPPETLNITLDVIGYLRLGANS